MGKTNQNTILNKDSNDITFKRIKIHQMIPVVLLSACCDSESIGSEQPKKS